LVNLFSIVVSAGLVQLAPISESRFVSFWFHAALASMVLLALEMLRLSRFGSLASAQQDVKRYVLARYVVVNVCLVCAGVYFRYGTPLGGDGPHYFIQTRSLLFDGDLDFENEYERVKAYLPMPERAVGSSLLSLPFMVAAHSLVSLGNALGQSWEADGFGYPYQAAFGMASIVFASLGLVTMLKLSARFFGAGVALLSVVTVSMGSFLAWYIMIEPAMPHAMSAAWMAFFTAYWMMKRPVNSSRDWTLLGVIGGIAALVRWQNAVLLLLPLLDHALQSEIPRRKALWMGFGALVAFVPQLIVWQALGRSAFVSPSQHGIDWTQLNMMEVLYSTNRGLFPWSPVTYLAVLGLFLWVQKWRRLALLCLLGVLLQVYINGTVYQWWGGWAFGGRRFDNSIVFFVLGFAAFVEFLKRRPSLLVGVAAIALVLWNVGLMTQSRQARIPEDKNVSFEEVTIDNARMVYRRLGYPGAWPLNWLFAQTYDVGPSKFDKLYGHVGFGNLRLPFDPHSNDFVGNGWGPAEKDASGRWFRWSLGRESSLLLPLRGPHAYILRVELSPYIGTVPNVLELRVNGQRQAEQRLVESATLTWRVGRDLWRSGVNVLRFGFTRSARPSDHSSSQDTRELAAAFYHLELISDDEPDS
jgi:hypothetical protein